MTIELLPLRDEPATDHGIDFHHRQDVGDCAEQDVVSGGFYNVASLTHGLESLSKSSAKSGVDEQSHLVPTDKPCIEGTRHDYEEDGSLPATSFSTTPRLRRIWKHIWVAVLAVIILVVLSTSLALSPMQYQCGYDYGWESPSQASPLFLIDIAFGTLSFSLAKFVDVAWDVVIGRGGQALLGWISYGVCTDCLMWIMESSPVSYDLYTTLTFSWTSFASLRLLPEFVWTRNRFSHKLVMVLLAMDIIWVAIFPSVMGATTGYIANSDLNVRLRDGKYISSADFFHAERVYTCFEACVEPFNYTTLREHGPNTTLWEEVRKLDQSPDRRELSFISYSGAMFLVSYAIDNTTYQSDYLQKPGVIQCIANQTYRWGFSTTLFGMAAGGIMFWVISTYSIWVHVNRKSELCKKGRRLGKYRAAMDMAEAVGQDLGPNICAYNDKQLEKALRRRPPIKYAVWPPTDENCTEDRPAHIGLSRARQGGAVVLRFGQTYGHS